MLLQNVNEPWQAFWFNHGAIAHGLAELETALAAMDDERFSYHVAGDKNDIAVWVKEMIRDEALADTLLHCGSCAAAHQAVADRIALLMKSAAGAGQRSAVEKRGRPKAKKPAAKKAVTRSVKPASKKTSMRSAAARTEASGQPAVLVAASSAPEAGNKTGSRSLWNRFLGE